MHGHLPSLVIPQCSIYGSLLPLSSFQDGLLTELRNNIFRINRLS